ncbi:MAG: efflux RND transporter periplasmic adaptor subunit [Bacteroidetes bacterium]|nr:efflux RND transporter periplasmic adaptor subunit [Bacteroidota bacterium]
MEKQNKRTLIYAAGTLVIGLALGWFFFHPSGNMPEDEHMHDSKEQKETIWTCSMHPQIRKKEPGKCPICGMDLIPLETYDTGVNPLAVRMSPTAMELAHVQTMVVNKGGVKNVLRLNGKVQADERQVLTQSSHIPGRIEKLLVNFTGEMLHKGDVMAYVYSPELVTAQEELFEAEKMKSTQPELFNAAKEKLKNWKLSEQQIENILKAGKATEQFPVLANESGYVLKKHVNPGDYIRQGEPLFEVANLSQLWVLFDVYESEMIWVKKGAKVSYTVSSLPGRTFQGTVSYVDPVIDPQTRVAKARVEVSNPDYMLKPEMFVNGMLETQVKAGSSLLSIPKSAVLWTGTRSVVYVLNNSAEGVSFLMRQVELGPELEDAYLVESGLEAGEEIVVNGTFSIDAAAQLAGKPSMMSSKNEKPQKQEREKSGLGAAKQALMPVFEAYFKMEKALVEDDFAGAKTAAQALESSIQKVEMSAFHGSNHALWMKSYAALLSALKEVNGISKIEALRDHFLNISEAMIPLAEQIDPYKSPLYVQHCPMANFNKGGDWLSKGKEILNPYMGQSMPTCGETVKTLP